MSKPRTARISPELQQFFSDWLAWAESGGPKHGVFSPHQGLCNCVIKFTGSTRRNYELIDLFHASGMSATFPFGGWSIYSYDVDTASMHLNVARLAWVRKQLEIADEN